MANACLVSDIPECTEVVEDKAIDIPKSPISEDLTRKTAGRMLMTILEWLGKLKESGSRLYLRRNTTGMKL